MLGALHLTSKREVNCPSLQVAETERLLYSLSTEKDTHAHTHTPLNCFVLVLESVLGGLQLGVYLRKEGTITNYIGYCPFYLLVLLAFVQEIIKNSFIVSHSPFSFKSLLEFFFNLTIYYKNLWSLVIYWNGWFFFHLAMGSQDFQWVTCSLQIFRDDISTVSSSKLYIPCLLKYYWLMIMPFVPEEVDSWYSCVSKGVWKEKDLSPFILCFLFGVPYQVQSDFDYGHLDF